jgi:tetratricopeptide (TPR) repeat protein
MESGCLRITIRVLEIKSLRLSGEKIANGPAAALPVLENELAWEVLEDSRSTGLLTRTEFRSRARQVPNRAYANYIAALSIYDDELRIEQLLKTLELFRDFPQASFELGSHYFLAGDTAKAIQYLKPALREAQDLLETQFMLGTCYLKQENPADAIPVYRAFLARLASLGMDV